MFWLILWYPKGIIIHPKGMSRPVLASETAALGLADEAYGQMVTLNDPGGAAALEPELVRMFDALQNQTVPAMPTDIAHGVRSMRNGAFEILGDVMAGMADDRATDVLRLAEANVRARLVQQAREAVNGRNRGAGMAWTRYLGNRLGGALRNVVGLVNEGATGRVFWGQGSFEDRRVETEVQAQIAARFAGQTYDTLAPADQELVRQEVGRLAPNIMAFNSRELLEWARATPSTVNNPTAVPPAMYNYYELCAAVLGTEEVGSRYAIPILSLMQKNPVYRQHIEAVYNDRAAEQPVQRDYNRVRNERRQQDNLRTTLETTIQQIESALQLMSQIREQEQARARNQQNATDLNADIAAAPAGSREKQGLQERKQGFIDKATQASTNLTRLVGDVKGKYRRLLVEAATPPATPGAPAPTPPNFNTILLVNAAGGLTNSNEPDTFINTFQELLDTNGRALGRPIVVGVANPGLRDQLDQVKDAISTRDEPYSPTNEPTLYSGGYKDFNDLKSKHDAASTARSTGNTLTSHQLLYELLYRQTRVEIPPTGVVPPAGTRNLPLEEAQLRATIATMMLMDRVDSSMDEGFAVRHANNLARNRMMRFAERGARISFKEFVEDNLARQEAFKELGSLTLESTANDILSLVNTEKIKIENLPELMRQLELLGQDQLAGEGNLEFGVDVRPLLYQIQLAWYRRKAEPLVDKVNEPGVDNKAEKLLAMLKEEAPKATPPQVTPGSQPLSVETKKQSWLRRTLDKVREDLKGVEDTSEKGEILKRKMGILEAIGPAVGAVGTEVVAEIIANAVIKIPKLFSRKGATEAVGGVVEEAADRVVDLDAFRKKQAAKANRVVNAAKKAVKKVA